jgi:porphobilinogen synthase
MAIFPVVEGKKTAKAEEAYNPKGLVPRVVREIKKTLPRDGP